VALLGLEDVFALPGAPVVPLEVPLVPGLLGTNVAAGLAMHEEATAAADAVADAAVLTVPLPEKEQAAARRLLAS